MPSSYRIYGVRNGSANEKGNNRIGQVQNAPHQKTQAKSKVQNAPLKTQAVDRDEHQAAWHR